MLPIIGAGAAFEDAGSTTGSSTGTALTTSYSQLIAATSFPYCGFLLNVAHVAATQALVTVALGGSGSEKVLIDDLEFVDSTTPDISGSSIFLPIHVPAGSRLAAKASAASSVTANLIGVGVGSPSGRGFAGASAMGSNGTKGTQIDPGGTANTKGSWTQITASTAEDYAALMMIVGSNAATVHNTANFLVDIGVGGSGSEVVLVPNLYTHSNNTNDFYQPRCFGPFPCDIPAGSRLSIRAQSSTNQATNRLFDAILYGFIK